MRHWLALALALISFSCFAQADYAREQRWADEITPAVLVGDPVQLTLPVGRKFLGIYAPNSKARAGVVLVHGLGMHPDWSVVHPLRSQLSEQGYATLSVQMPVRSATDYLAAKLASLDEHQCDLAAVLPPARALREQVDWAAVRDRTRGNVFAEIALELLVRLEVAPPSGRPQVDLDRR